MKIVSGHQPAYLPWLGLLHKASLCDIFIVMDDVQFISDDFIHRNKIKTAQGGFQWLTVPLDIDKKNPLPLIRNIGIRHVGSSEKDNWQEIHWKSIRLAYSKARYFQKYSEIFEEYYLAKPWENLVELNVKMLRLAFEWFSIKAEIVFESNMGFTGKKSDRILEHGKKFGANVLITGAQGANYIHRDEFEKENIKVIYQSYQHPVYFQRFGNFVSHLSFIDLIFNYGPEAADIAFKGNLKRDEI